MSRPITANDPIFIAHGRGSGELADSVAKVLNLPVVNLNIVEYDDSEADVPHIKDNIRSKEAIFIGSIPDLPRVKANDVIMDYVYAGDALREAKVRSFHYVIPYLPGLRKDRTKGERTALTAQRNINTIMQTAPDGVMVVEPHEERIQGFFPANNRPDFLWATNLFAANLAAGLKDLGVPSAKVRVIGPDHGAKVRASQLTALMRNVYKFQANPHFGIADKDRISPDSTRLMGINGRGALKNAWVILPDDIVASGGTQRNPAVAIKKRGASAVFAVATHPVLTRDKDGIPIIQKELDKPNSAIDGFLFANTLKVPDSIRNHPRAWPIDIGGYLALAIHNAWGVPIPNLVNGQGSLRGLNQGEVGPLDPQKMPAALRETLARKVGQDKAAYETARTERALRRQARPPKVAEPAG